LLLIGSVVAVAALGTWLLDDWRRQVDAPAGKGSRARGKSPYEGKPAPDFALPDARSGEFVHLSDSRNQKPTVLFFGSFGCDLFCGQVAEIRRLHHEYGKAARFLFVYVRDANHPNAELDEFLRQRTPTDRGDRIAKGLEYYTLDMPCLLDKDDGRVEQLYSAYPERMFIVGPDGKVFWDSTDGISAEGLRLAEGEERLRDCLHASVPGNP
jgi:hypothetical protein